MIQNYDYITTATLEIRDEQIIPFVTLYADTVYTPYYVVWNNGCGTITIKENKDD
jgi:hypothetical protein